MRLRGWLSRLFLELRAGIYVGNYSVRIRDLVWDQIQGELGEGNVVMVWPANNDCGFDFDTCGINRRIPVDFDGLKLCAFQAIATTPTQTETNPVIPPDENW
jgi:CRISPR-associated protein Cas2